MERFVHVLSALIFGCCVCSTLSGFHDAAAWSRVLIQSRQGAISCGSIDSELSEKSDLSLFDKAVQKTPRLYVGSPPFFGTLYVSEISLSSSLKNLVCNNASMANTGLNAGSLVTLSVDQSHYLSTVLRLNKAKVPATVRVFDGVDEYLAELVFETAVSRGSRSSPLVARCTKRLRVREHPIPSCWIFVAAPKKKDRNRWLVEKCTELGVTGFSFLDTEFSETPEKFQKLLTYSVEAAEQCERLDLPHFVKFASGVGDSDGSLSLSKMSSLLNLWATDPDRFPILVCRERSETSISAIEVLQSINEDFEHVACFIGPEGGWSDTEEKMFDAMEADFPSVFHNVVLGSNVVRTETACVAIAAAHSMTRKQ